ncbi:uncharacterized protein A4U43_C04F22680 [Asparagus officinalis]|uniref:Arginase n=1 Tax=Asparagus officinalis TaxID=4686 RepID=A0A5P1F8A8_ASPOF|nr:uncharacterized protein A4U43_C04F22680 [Asparagus officinalis]
MAGKEDLKEEKTSESIYSGRDRYTMVGEGPLRGDRGGRKLLLEESEKRWGRKKDDARWAGDGDDAREECHKLGEGVKGVYISVDVDCLDPAFAPGVSHIEPGGLSFRDVLNILHNLQGDVVAADVVEFNPQRDTVDGMTAMVAAKLVRELTAKISK